jgi:hypothetical protein
MADKLSKQQRSVLMAAVRSSNTEPELAVRRALHAAGFRYRLHKNELPGRADINIRETTGPKALIHLPVTLQRQVAGTRLFHVSIGLIGLCCRQSLEIQFAQGAGAMIRNLGM